MKKMLSLALITFSSSVMFACSNSDNEAKADFKGIITEMNGQAAIVYVDEGEMIRSSGAEVTVNLAVNEDTTFTVGDRVKVGYDGGIRETYPLSINTVYVELLESE